MNNQDKEAFERWWNEEGSGMPPKPGEGTIADLAAINALLRRYQITAYERAKLKVLPHLAERAEGLK